MRHSLTLACLLLTLLGCTSARPAVIGSGAQVADLWWAGELTDTLGNRWDVAILPGVRPSLDLSSEAFARFGPRFRHYGEAAYWRKIGTMSSQAFDYSGDCLSSFLIHGIGEDMGGTGKTVAILAHERPFGWMPQIAWRSFWGYLLKPAGRLVLAPAGAAGGAVAGAIVPIGGILYPPLVGLGDVAVVGIAVPAVRVVWQQPAWLFCLLNSEPGEDQDGRWGLSIIARPPGWKPPAASAAAEAPPGPVVLDREQLRAIAQEMIDLERCLARESQHQAGWALRRHGLRSSDGALVTVQLSADARAWLADESAAEIARMRDAAAVELGPAAGRLPPAADLSGSLEAAVGTGR